MEPWEYGIDCLRHHRYVGEQMPIFLNTHVLLRFQSEPEAGQVSDQANLGRSFRDTEENVDTYPDGN